MSTEAANQPAGLETITVVNDDKVERKRDMSLDTAEVEMDHINEDENSEMLQDAARAAKSVFASSPKAVKDGVKREYTPHSSEGRQYMRDMILGVNDGLVSMFLLVFGVAGGDLNNSDVLLAGIAGAVAGAISMGLGEYLATKSQREVYMGDMKLEKEHFVYHRERELEEAATFLQELGFRGKQLEDALKTIDMDDKRLLKLMMAFEFGMNEEDERQPWMAACASGCLFIAGSLPAWLPFTFTTDITTNLVVAGVLCGIALFFTGAVKTIMTRGNMFYSGMENLLFGLAGAGLSYLVGFLYQA